ncbi:DegT/DnrJ/EryC1/StrS family aminotransferase [Candidatus Margulisiibacteriota bacterium]
MSVPFFDITKQNEAVRQEIDDAVKQVIDSGRYILGENVKAFEQEFADYCGAKFAVGVASGTDALHLALLAAGVKAGDEVITSPFTFVASAEVIAYCNAKPVFVDIDPNTFNLNASKIEEKITPKTKALLPIHLYGQPCEMDKIMALAKKHKLAVIEDCAQATGAEYNGKKVGSFGLGGFSFFPTKNLGCFGDGGMITTNNEKITNEIKVLRNHGSRKTYHHNIIGYNSRLDELQATILRVKLRNMSTKRQVNASLYASTLKNVAKIMLPPEIAGGKHSYNQYTVRTQDRDGLQAHLKARGIGAMVYYPVSVHLQEAFSSLGHKKGSFPMSEQVQNEVLSLPIFPELSEKQILEVCSAIKEFYGQ